MIRLTVAIPARNEPFLQRTVDEVLGKAVGEVECVVVLDGYWPSPALREHPNLRIVHFGQSRGMRQAINTAAAMARGDFFMKLDAHCMLDRGYDQKLIAEMRGPNWVMVPRRKRLDADNWRVEETKRPDVDYEYVSFPDDPNDFGGPGLHGRKWDERSVARRDNPEYDIDDLMTFQGSCWLTRISYFRELELMDQEGYGSFAHEAQEICFKAWLSGGRVVVNKKTWYAHLHKGKKHGRGYSLDESVRRKGTAKTNSWMDGKGWDKATLPFASLIERFWPVPGWPEDRSLWISPS